MIPEFPQIKPLELEDRLWIHRKLKQTSREICELSLGNIFIWKDFDHTLVTCINHNICMLINPPNEPAYFLEPIGSNKLAETAEILLKHAGRISRVSINFLAQLPKDRYLFEPLRNQFDYIYARANLAELKGKKYDGKRNHIKRFSRQHPNYTYQTLDPNIKEKALELFEKWFAIREESRFFPRLAYTSQKGAVIEAFSYFKELHLLGGALFDGNKLCGFTLGSEINPELVSVHFLYGDPALPGVTQTLLREACRKTYTTFKYIDLEQDLGIPGLRTAKLSYHPLKMGEKFEVKPIS
jgi:hypothetical protein